jgi:hypothetical protein
MENAIIFAGCSYTFGEGLELYVDTPKWINQRNYITNDPELKAVWDKDGQDFRLNNNFPSIVAKHFKSTPYQDSNNGGSFASSTRYIKKAQRIIKSEKKNKALGVIFQLSSFDREPFHFDYSCKCDKCKGTIWAYWGEFYMHLEYISDLVSKKTNTEQITKFQNKTIANQNAIVKYFSQLMSRFYDEFNYKNFIDTSLKNKEYFSDIMENITINIDEVINKIKREALISNQELIKTFEREIGPVYFLDSWCEDSSNLIFENKFYYDRLIPLMGDDGRYYKKWKSWEKTINIALIKDDFPKTENHHPSLHCHQLIGKSIINFLNKKSFLNIRYI